mgnify:CR=1 FL=1
MSENKYLQWFSSKTPSIYWHDSAVREEQLAAFANGAVGMTTNPFLINSTLNGDRAFWADGLAKLDHSLTGDEKVYALMNLVTGYYAEQVRPIFDQGVAGKGYVCAQTNPNKTGDAKYMVEQAKRLASWAPNIVVKIPATNAGIQAYEECAALGLNVAATVSFTVPQVLAVGAAAQRGKERAKKNGIKPGLSIAVLMCGRLDDYLRDVAHDNGAKVEESDIVQAGIACLKKAYGIFNERGYDTYLMPAGCRGANQILELAGAKMIFSIAPKIVKLIDSNSPCEERINVPVAQDVIDRLMTMPEFRKAYLEDGMKPEEFITFGSTNRTTDQFINDGWNPLVNFKF